MTFVNCEDRGVLSPAFWLSICSVRDDFAGEWQAAGGYVTTMPVVDIVHGLCDYAFTKTLL